MKEKSLSKSGICRLGAQMMWVVPKNFGREGNLVDSGEAMWSATQASFLSDLQGALACAACCS